MIRAIWLAVIWTIVQSVQFRSISAASLPLTYSDEQNGYLDNVLKRVKKSQSMVFPFE